LKNKSVKKVVDYLIILDKLSRGGSGTFGKSTQNGKSTQKGGEGAWWDLIYQMDFLEEDLIQIGKFIKQVSREEGASCFKLLNSLDKLPLSVSGRLSAKILCDKLKHLVSLKNKKVSEILQEIYHISGCLGGYGEEGKAVRLNLNKFFDIAKSHEDLYGDSLFAFVNYLESLTDLNIQIEEAAVESSGVRLMTSHATKGLEYRTVIITNMAQKRFPMERAVRRGLVPFELYPEFRDSTFGKSTQNGEIEDYVKDYEMKNQLLEERRLCYVSFTRARDKLILTYAKDYGGKKFFPSQFLEEINYKGNPDISFFC